MRPNIRSPTAMKCTTGGTVALGVVVAVAGTTTAVAEGGGVSVAVGARVAEGGSGEAVPVLAMMIWVAGGVIVVGPAVTQAAKTRPMMAGQSLSVRAATLRKRDNWLTPASTCCAV